MNSLHEHALRLSCQHRLLESELVKVLGEIESLKLHRTLGFSSVFSYTVSALGLSEPVAYTLITVARKARELGALSEAISTQKLSVNRASRIVAALTRENANELIAFAATHTQRETDQEVARLSDRRTERFENLRVPAEVLELLKKAQGLMASRKKRNLKFDETLKLVLEEFLNRHEPVRKAERARKRAEKTKAKTTDKISAENSVCTKPDATPKAKTARIPVTALTRHIVNIRDQARCTFVDYAGHRCTNDRWLHAHHRIPVSRGGSNEPANLVTLCSFHQDLVHQLSLPIEGQVNWIREPGRAYSH